MRRAAVRGALEDGVWERGERVWVEEPRGVECVGVRAYFVFFWGILVLVLTRREGRNKGENEEEEGSSTRVQALGRIEEVGQQEGFERRRELRREAGGSEEVRRRRTMLLLMTKAASIGSIPTASISLDRSSRSLRGVHKKRLR